MSDVCLLATSRSPQPIKPGKSDCGSLQLKFSWDPAGNCTFGPAWRDALLTHSWLCRLVTWKISPSSHSARSSASHPLPNSERQCCCRSTPDVLGTEYMCLATWDPGDRAILNHRDNRVEPTFRARCAIHCLIYRTKSLRQTVSIDS